MSLAAALAACGGGGGDDNGAPAPPPSGAPVTVSGNAVFESIPAKANGGLNYAGASDRPIRGATVQLIDAADAVLATTTTSATGAYSVASPTAGAVRVRVRAELRRSGSGGGDRDITVRDNTSGEALYVVDSAPFTPATAAVTQNVRAGSGWGGSSYTATRAAAPFAILDAIYDGQARIESAASVALSLKVFWSVNNRPASGSLTTGAIGTSFFTAQGGGALYILGSENTDTDEYDSHVIVHEFGHFLQFAVSRDDSVGGAHGAVDKLDMRVAFSEGWGNAWSGIALGDPVYADSLGAMQAAGFTIDVSVPAVADPGWYSEAAAQYLIYSANNSFGFGAVYGALTALRPLPAWSSLHAFASTLKTASGNAADVTALWATQAIVAVDAFGSGETNNGGVPISLPVYKTHTAALGATQNYCVTRAADPDREGNKLGEFVFISFTASGSRTLTVTRTSSSGAADPDFDLLKSDASKQTADSADVNAEVLTTTLPNGTHTIALTDFEFRNTNNGQSCFDLRIQ